MNFDVQRLRRKHRPSGGSRFFGRLTLPDYTLAQHVLSTFGNTPAVVSEKQLKFGPDKKTPRPDPSTVAGLRSSPFEPSQHNRQLAQLEGLGSRQLTAVSTGFRSREGAYVAEIDLLEKTGATSATLSINGDTRTLCIDLEDSTSSFTALHIPLHTVELVYDRHPALGDGGECSILFQLTMPCSLVGKDLSGFRGIGTFASIYQAGPHGMLYIPSPQLVDSPPQPQ